MKGDSHMDRKRRKFENQEYRHSYAASFLDSLIATQIKVLREQRGWTQKQLAERSGMKQSRISAIEDVNYSSWSMATLKRLAVAFDLAPVFTFEAFGEIFRRYAISRDNLERRSFSANADFGMAAGTELPSNVVRGPFHTEVDASEVRAETSVDSPTTTSRTDVELIYAAEG